MTTRPPWLRRVVLGTDSPTFRSTRRWIESASGRPGGGTRTEKETENSNPAKTLSKYGCCCRRRRGSTLRKACARAGEACVPHWIPKYGYLVVVNLRGVATHRRFTCTPMRNAISRMPVAADEWHGTAAGAVCPTITKPAIECARGRMSLAATTRMQVACWRRGCSKRREGPDREGKHMWRVRVPSHHRSCTRAWCCSRRR